LAELTIAHLDCDAFYAAVEKRDKPDLVDKPVIVGGGRRGVVSTACYIARINGVHSAMPMYTARKACPDAVVIRPNMAKYRRIGLEIRQLMRDLTPSVEPLSIDEAFLDLTGTERLHGGPPAQSLARLALKIEDQTGLTVSIGLSYNKFLAKVASDLDKPRGFALIGRTEAQDFLASKPVSLIWGVGKALRARLAKDRITRIADLLPFEKLELEARYGAMGRRLYNFARGLDSRKVEPDQETKSISAETTFDEDIAASEELLHRIWPLCETLARRLKASGYSAKGITLKLKTADFRLITRAGSMADPTVLAEILYREAEVLLRREANGRAFRLIGIGAHALADLDEADPPGLLDQERKKLAGIERAIDAVRDKLGPDAIAKGRGFSPKGPRTD
jgi:DNA polymerase-4